jgi:soluble lytic murein transglycosylase-like protein
VSHAYLAYPVVGLLALAASLPIAAPSLFLGSAPPPPAAVRPAGPVVVSTTAGASPAQPVGPADRGRPTPEDRWWRSQAARVFTTTSSVTSAPVPQPAPPPGLVRPPEPAPAAPAARSIPVTLAVPPEVRLTARVPAQIRRWEPLILKAARKHDVDPALIAAVMMTESSGNPTAISPMGAVGLMQVLNGPPDPEENIDIGVQMLSSHLRRFGSIDLALAAYNAGIGNVLTHGGVPPFQETRDHIARTLASYTAWRAV